MVSAFPSLLAVLTALINPATSPLAMLKTVGTVRSSNRSNWSGTERRRLAARFAPRDDPSLAPNQRCRRDFNHVIGENSWRELGSLTKISRVQNTQNLSAMNLVDYPGFRRYDIRAERRESSHKRKAVAFR